MTFTPIVRVAIELMKGGGTSPTKANSIIFFPVKVLIKNYILYASAEAGMIKMGRERCYIEYCIM